jgi:GAF domain-containing protein
MSNNAARSELEIFTELSQALLAAEDVVDALLVLRASLAIDAKAGLLVRRYHTGNATLLYSITDTEERAANEVIPYRLEAAHEADDASFCADTSATQGEEGRFIESVGGRSYARIAIYGGSDSTDLFFVVYSQPRTFDEIFRQLLIAFAAQTNLVIQNRRLLETSLANEKQLAQQVRVQQTLNALANRALLQSDETALMQLTMETLKEISEADHAGFALINPDGINATIVAEFPESPALGAQFDAATNPIFNEILDGRTTPFVIEDIENDPKLTPAARSLLLSVGSKAVLISPLLIEDKLIGSIGVDFYSAGHKFNDDQIELIQTISTQLALFLQDNRTRRAREQAVKRARMLDQVSSQFLENNRVEDILIEAAHGLSRMVDARRVSIRLGTPD